MNQVERVEFVETCGPNEYKEKLMSAVQELQSSNLEVEINHSMSQAQKGIGYMYSAVVTGRQK